MKLIQKIQRTFVEYLRVLKRTKKPSMEEFKVTVKIAGLGILIIGLLGFLVGIIKMYLGNLF